MVIWNPLNLHSFILEACLENEAELASQKQEHAIVSDITF